MARRRRHGPARSAPVECQVGTKINVAGLDKAELLAALYNATYATGLGILDDMGRDITVEEARADLSQLASEGRPLLLDNYRGRTFRMSFDSNLIDSSHYDSIAGQGIAAEVVANLRNRDN